MFVLKEKTYYKLFNDNELNAQIEKLIFTFIWHDISVTQHYFSNYIVCVGGGTRILKEFLW